MKGLSLRLTWLVAVAALLVMCAELVRVVWEVTAGAGPAGVPLDGVVQHKVGELLIAIPFASVALLAPVWDAERVELLIRRSRAPMWIGALLNGIAWLSLRYIKSWHLWCLLLLVFGLAGPSLARRLLRKSKAMRPDSK